VFPTQHPPPPLHLTHTRRQLRKDAGGRVIVDTKEPGLKELRMELAMRTLSPQHMYPTAVPSTPTHTRHYLDSTGIPQPPPTAVMPPKLAHDTPRLTCTHLWTVQPSVLPAKISSAYRPPHVTSSQEQFEFLRDEREPLDGRHFMRKNEMTEYLRSAIRTQVNLKSTGH